MPHAQFFDYTPTGAVSGDDRYLKTVKPGTVERVSENGDQCFWYKAMTCPALIYPVPDVSTLERTSDDVIYVDFTHELSPVPHRPREASAQLPFAFPRAAASRESGRVPSWV
ncbi:uncharacterized protein METZ01_LOCUS25429 [marine metagenome]|uniref:Uncharacterized protein n=1 Tax=marine metagenome TaxID=408172 RepID=A0A381PZV9_9ZZZZ|tara:strand:- start:23443 stop:23778 length:336 start_codon:yes stop_codon:yes gene_type:complete